MHVADLQGGCLVEHFKLSLLPDIQLPTGKMYRATRADDEFIAQQVQGLLEAGIIQRSNSPNAFPVVVARAPGREPRFCTDYRQLNRTRSLEDGIRLQVGSRRVERYAFWVEECSIILPESN